MVLYIAAPPPDHKTCSKCGQCEKHYKCKSKHDGLQTKCVQCDKANRVANKDKMSARKKKYDEEHKDEIRAYQKRYREEHKDEMRALHKTWYAENKQQIQAKQTVYMRNRRQTDDAFRLLENCRRRLRKVLKGKLKTAKTVELIGCTSKELADHLERTMSPEVRALRDAGVEIDVDHIIPCAAFDFTIPEHQRVCFYYTNLQYLDKPTNLSKNDKLPPGFDFASWFEARAQSLELDL